VSIENKDDAHAIDNDTAADDRLIEALDRGEAAKAAAILREADALSKRAREALADMLDGDPNAHPHLRQIYPYRLKLTRWPGKGRSRYSFIDISNDIELHQKVTAVIRKKKVSATIAFHEVAKTLSKGGFAKVRDAYRRTDKRLLKFKK
jgi:hypothetical protein